MPVEKMLAAAIVILVFLLQAAPLHAQEGPETPETAGTHDAAETGETADAPEAAGSAEAPEPAGEETPAGETEPPEASGGEAAISEGETEGAPGRAWEALVLGPFTYRVEGSLAYDHLFPHDVYGSREGMTLSFFHAPIRKITYYITGGGYFAGDAASAIATVGLYADPIDFMYTHTALTSSTPSEYTPLFRFDHDFNFRFLSDLNLVWTLGITYIHYHENDSGVYHKDLSPSTGLSYYFVKDWVLEYRIFLNVAFPGEVLGHSHLVSAGYGREFEHWTFLTLTGGRQCYLATYVPDRPRVNNWTLGVMLDHRHWLADEWGLFGGAKYEKLFGLYDVVGASFGGFYSF